MACIVRHQRNRFFILLIGCMLGAFLGSAVTLTMISSDCAHCYKTEKRDIQQDVIPVKGNHKQIPTVVSSTPSEKQKAKKERVISTLLDSERDDSLYVALLPSEDSTPETISIAARTWGRTVSHLEIFVNKNTAALTVPPEVTVTKLYDGLQNDHPMTAELLQILKYIYNNRLNASKWFLLASEKVYVNYYAFSNLLQSIPSHVIYTGSATKTLSETITYCSGDAGVLISQLALVNLISKYEECEKWAQLYSWDKGLGKCVETTSGCQCSSNVAEYFYKDENKSSNSLENLTWMESLFSTVFAIYPITSLEHMYTLYFHFVSIELKKTQDKLDILSKSVLESCQDLPESTIDLEMVQYACDFIRPDKSLPTGEQDKNSQLTKTKLPSRFRPMNHYQAQTWKYFDVHDIYIDDTIEPLKQVGLYKYYSRELKKATQDATVEVNNKYYPSKMKFRSLQNGYVKHDPLVGNEYIIDAHYINLNEPGHSVTERVRILRPLQTAFRVKPSKSDVSEKVHIVVPISGVTERCFEFLDMYVRILRAKELVHLVLVVFGNGEIKAIREKSEAIVKKHSKADITIVQGQGNFSRARALHQGMSTLKDTDLAFLCDVDMQVDKSFFNRCRRNTIHQHLIYYPEVFKMYNPKFSGFAKKRQKKLIRQRGHWGNYAFGMLCIYKSDYNRIGGLNTKMMGWGGEDVDFFEKVLRSRIEILRAPDIGLIHRWHPRQCSPKTMTDSNYAQCLSSRSEILGDRRELAQYIYLLQEKHPELTL